MSAALPLCIIGAGVIGMLHVEVATASELVDLCAVVEADPARCAALSDQGLPAVTSLDQVPGDVRAAIIATPTPDHHDSALNVISRGWGVLVEKPTGATLDEGRAMVAAAERAGLPLVTGHHRRCHPFSIAAREVLRQIGEPVGAQGLWSLRKHDSYYDADWRRQPGAGPLMTNLSHEIDLLRFLLGDMVEASALLSSARRGLVIEDTASLSFRFANGALGSFLMSDAGPSPWSFEGASHENPAIVGSGEDYLRIIGTEGALQFPSLTLWGRSGPGEIEWSRPLKRHDGPDLPRIDPLLAQLERFAGVLAGQNDDILCTGADGVAALEMTLAAALSGKLGQPVAAGAVPGDFRGV